MSGCSDTSRCPNCEKQMNTYIDWKPFDLVSHECLNCGLTLYMKLDYLTLDELNEYRKEWEEEPLKELPEQDFEW